MIQDQTATSNSVNTEFASRSSPANGGYQTMGHSTNGGYQTNGHPTNGGYPAINLADENFPVDLPNRNLKEVLEGIVVNAGVSHGLAFLGFATTLSLAAQGRFDVESLSGSPIPISIFGLGVARSGEGKSTLARLVGKEVRVGEQKAQAAYESELVTYRSAYEIWNIKRQTKVGALKRALLAGESSSLMESEVADLLRAEPQAPRLSRMCLEDTSREALFDTIGDGITSVGVLSTEGTNFFGGTVSKLFAPLNAIWSGDPQHINRVSKPPVSLTGKERLTAFIMIQPESLDAFIKKHGNEAMNSGFLPRFLVCDPPSKLGYRPPNTGPVESRALTRFHAIVAGLLDSPVGPRRTIALSGSAVCVR